VCGQTPSCVVALFGAVNPPSEDELFEAMSSANVKTAENLPLLVRTGMAGPGPCRGTRVGLDGQCSRTLACMICRRSCLVDQDVFDRWSAVLLQACAALTAAGSVRQLLGRAGRRC
jgi:hypothetical protein